MSNCPVCEEKNQGARRSGLSKDDSRLADVIRRHFHFYLVARYDANEVLPHLPADVRQHLLPIRKTHPEHCIGKDFSNDPFRNEWGLFRHRSQFG